MEVKTFSIIHASARPNGWRRSYENWMCNARFPEGIEYLLCVDTDGPFKDSGSAELAGVKVVWNNLRHCTADAYNAGAAESTGRILILNSDDMFAPPDWDESLVAVVPDLNAEFVLDVPTSANGLLTLQIFSRARYEKLGYAFYPEYLSAYADNEFTEHAHRDAVVLNARHVLFRHEHPGMYGPGWDDVYEHENSAQAYELGRALLETRRAAGFPYGNR